MVEVCGVEIVEKVPEWGNGVGIINCLVTGPVLVMGGRRRVRLLEASMLQIRRFGEAIWSGWE